jgi:6-phosphogluconolactonase (cycloisomerase 2 family)
MRSFAVLVLLGTAAIAGCARSQLPTAAPATQQSAPSAVKQNRVRSWMAPAAKSGDLLYVTNANSTVTVYSYPQGKLVGTLGGFEDPYGVCVDKKANVYITDYSAGTISEFAHGGTKAIAKLEDTEYDPQGCSVDLTTGDLAVANYETGWDYPGNLSVYHKARGVAHAHIVEDLYYYFFCGYDGDGNLYADGQFSIYGQNFEFARLSGKGGTLQQLLLPADIGYAGGIAWDGTHLAVGDQTSTTIDEFAIANGKATLANATTLNGAGTLLQFAIDGSTLVAPNQFSSSSSVLFYKYPAGGSPTRTITNGVFFPRAVAISLRG